MDLLRILGQGRQTTSLTLDASLHKTDGDLALEIHSFLIAAATGAAGYTGAAALHVKPTNGPNWSRKPVPMYLLMRDYSPPYSNTGIARWWQLRHPYILGDHDGLDLQVSNGGADSVSATAFGIKRTGKVEAPKRFWAPRILWSRLSSVGNQALVPFDQEDLRNFGDAPMVVHEIVVIGSLAAGDSGNNLQVRIRLGEDAWMVRNNLAPIGAVRNYWTNRIHIPDVVVPPDAAFVIDVFNNSGQTYAQVDVAIIGSVEQSRR